MDAYNHAREALARIAADARRYPRDPEGYAERVRELLAEGMDNSDAQGIADMEHESGQLARWLDAIKEAA